MRALLLTTVLVTVVLVRPLAFASAGPMATLKQLNSEVDKLLHLNPQPGSPAEQKLKDDIKALAGKLLDYGELAKQSLASNWDKLSKQQQEEFVSTLRQLTERNYVKQLRGNLNYQVLYKNEQVDGETATVSTVVKVKTQGKTTDAEIVYKLRKVADKWMVWDLVTDDTSLVRTYKGQWTKMITDKGYDELIKKLKAKLAEDNP